jgi:dipeptidyl aminopeptidase/acylaminoacyl peptidase
MKRHTFFLLAGLLLISTLAHAQSKKILDHDAYDIWKGIAGQAISNDGSWVLYSLTLQDGDPELKVTSLTSDVSYSVPRGSSARFTHDSRYVVALVKPEKAAVQEAQEQKKGPDEQPKDSLLLLDLADGNVLKVERVKGVKLPAEAGGWVGYLLEKQVKEAGETEAGEEGQRERQEQQAEEAGKEKNANQIGTTLMVRSLDSGSERSYENVMEYVFSKDGEKLVYTSSSEDGTANGVTLVELDAGEVTSLMSGEGIYKSAVLDQEGEQVAFLSNRDDYQAEQPSFTLYHWRRGRDAAVELATEGTPGMPSGWWVSERGAVTFSENGERVFLGTAPRPEPEVEDSVPEDERVKVDIWHWQDPLLQPMQLLQANRERNRSYSAVVHLRDQRLVQLATPDVPSVNLGASGDADLALSNTGVPYRMLISWESPGFNDVYLVDVNTGERSRVIEKLQGNASLSPDGEYVYWWDRQNLAWYARKTDGAAAVNLTSQLPYPIHNEDHDSPSLPSAYGSAGWTEGDREFLVYDRFDVWALDPTGREAPRNITEGRGRADSLRFRYVRLDREAEYISTAEPMLLSAFNLWTKDAGFYRDEVDGDRPPQQLASMARRFSNPTKAAEADVLLFTRSSVSEFPNIWASDADFANMQQVSDANPQQADYLWSTVELIQWRSTDGRVLQGLLYKPEDFDPSRKYPMMVYFYERNSNNLHTHYEPIPHRSVIRPTFYASRGYLVFIPDIVYQVGYPGESAMKCVMPGVLELIDQGYVDAANIGVQGHSWGGYQIAYMVTKTDLFKAAAGGAPVSNMTSAYGGIRWASGMSRMFQYERTQSRLGATLWEAPIRYIENSPIFWADKVETPLLMMHNDHDGAVPWYQGIEMFVALRRLGKPAWLVNYNDEPHWPTTYANKRDWNIRMQQYFDHYLKGAAAPAWLADGIPAVEKGKTLGLEPAAEKAREAGGG